MALTRKLSSEFDQGPRRKGEAYFYRGAVTIVESTDLGVTARVRGSSRTPYGVELDWSDLDHGMIATCSCPHYDGGNFCKHLWAVVLAADAATVGPTLSNQGRVELHHRLDEEPIDDGSWQDDALDRKMIALIKSKGKAGVKKSHIKNWHASLSQLPMRSAAASGEGFSPAAAPVRERRAWFVIDVAASLGAGGLVINLHRQERHKNGEWGALKELRIRRTEVGQYPPDDARRLALALGSYVGSSRSAYGYGYRLPPAAGYQEQYSQVQLAPAGWEALLPELASGGRLTWLLSGELPAEESRPVAWDAGDAWRFRLAIAADDQRQTWIVRGELQRGETRVSLSEPVLLLEAGLVLFPNSLARLAPALDWRWILLLRAQGELTIPYADRQKLLGELWGGGAADDAALPANLKVQVEFAPPRGWLVVHPPSDKIKRFEGGQAGGTLFADVQFEYGDSRAALDDPVRIFIDAEGSRVTPRDAAGEALLQARLRLLKVQPRQRRWYYEGPGHVEFSSKRFDEIVSTLVGEGWHVEAEGRQVRRAGEFRLRVASGADWFDLESSIDFDGQSAALPELLAAVRANRKFVELGDGSQGMLPEEWLARFASLAEFAEVDGDKLRFRSCQALLLDAMLAEQEGVVRAELDRQFQRVRDRLRSFEGVLPRKPPRGFRGELRPYQEAGLGWLQFLADFGLGGCLADDMGLGKTVQVLARLLAVHRAGSRRSKEASRPSIVVAPKSLVFNWASEAERFTPQLRVLNYTGLDRKVRADDLAQVDLALTTYGTLRRDVEALQQQPFEYVILDEAQAIKNEQSISAKCCRLLTGRQRLVLTGTPIENHLGDLWSLFEFLNPGVLGRSSAFRQFARGGDGLTMGSGEAGGAPSDGSAPNAQSPGPALDTLRRGLAPFILRRTKEQVLADLPPKTEQTIQCELLPADRKRYDELRRHYQASLLDKVRKSGMNKTRMHVLEALLRLRQASCHSGLIDPKLSDKSSAKLEALFEQLAEVRAEGHKALVFSQFTSLLAIVRRRLDADGATYEYLDGRTRDRQKRVERFQTDPNCPLFLISLKAGGVGLNLTAADYVFLLDPWWNPAVEAQAIDRAHRIGQERPVFAYRLVATDTVEEKIVRLQSQKRALADAIIAGESGGLTNLTADDLAMLLE